MPKELFDKAREIPEGCVLIGESVYFPTAGNRAKDIKGPVSLAKYFYRKLADYLKDGLRP